MSGFLIYNSIQPSLPISEDNRSNDSIVIRKSILESCRIPWGPDAMLSTSWKTHLAIRSGFCRVSGNIEFTAGGPLASLRGWAGFINLLHKEVSLFRKYCQYWRLLVHTKRKKEEGREFVRGIVGRRYYLEDGTLFMMQYREGYKKYCDALEKWILWNSSSIVAYENISMIL